MLLDSNYNSSCKFGEDVVAYLYGEIDGGEKLRFEQHLSSCQTCADELNGFSQVRTSVLEWRALEFLPLATPVVEVPFETHTGERPEVKTVSNLSGAPMWIDRIRAFFKLSPGLMTAATGLAAVAICAGLLFIVFKSSTDKDDVAGKNKNDELKVKVVSSPTVEANKTVAATAVVANQNRSKPDKQAKAPAGASGDSAETPKEAAVPEKVSFPVKSTNGKNPKQVSNADKTVNKSSTKPSKPVKRPTLTDDGDEDDSLRLSDLFEEVSLR